MDPGGRFGGWAALFSEMAASATPPAGTGLGGGALTLTSVTGTDLTIITGTTSGACPATNDSFGSPIDSYQVVVDGGGMTNAPIVSNTGVGFSTTHAMTVDFGLSMKDLTAVQGAPAPAAGVEYDVTFHCINALDVEPNGTFTGAIVFDIPTSYHVLMSAPTPNPDSNSWTADCLRRHLQSARTSPVECDAGFPSACGHR